MSLKRYAIVAGAISLLIASGGSYALHTMGVRYSDVQRNVRIALGLPKFWQTEFNENASHDLKLRCPTNDPIVIVAGGQSNAANAYEPAPAADHNQQTFMFFGGNCYKLQSPVLGATGFDDSLWPALGDKLNAKTGRPIIFIAGAVGGSQIGDWLDGRSRYLSRLANRILLARMAGLKPDFVLWIQGETDAAVELAPEEYVREQQALIKKLDATGATDVQTPWVIYRSTHCMHRRSNGPDIDRAVTEYVRQAGGRIVLGPDVSSFDDRFRRDGCHLNTRGRDRLVAESIATLIGSRLIVPSDMHSSDR